MTDLKHVGILGMKWGRRKASSGSERSSSDHKTVSALKGKKLSEMSNDDLKKLTSRLQLEKQLKDLTKRDVSSGEKVVTDVLTGVGKQIASKFIADALTKGGSALVAAIKDRFIKG